jgi:ferritin-like protein
VTGRQTQSTSAGPTRREALRTAVAGTAVAGLLALGHGREGSASAAAPSAAMDAEILQAFLELEVAQQGFYALAARERRLTGELRTFAQTVGAQEAEHVAVLRRLLGGRGRSAKTSAVGEALSSPDAFRESAIALEEAVIAAYVGQGGNLTRKAVAAITPMVSVEARQVAWLRDLAGVSPAPRAADPARPIPDVVRELHEKGLIA